MHLKGSYKIRNVGDYLIDEGLVSYFTCPLMQGLTRRQLIYALTTMHVWKITPSGVHS